MAAWAQLTPAQRETDFRTLAGLTARYYTPLEWKRLAHQADGLAIGPWLARVRAAQSDNEFQRICAEYLGQFKDGHVFYGVETDFFADGGVITDLFDGKILIESVNTNRYPAAQYPLLAIGNEVVSVDGRAAGAVLDDLLKMNPAGAGRGARRLAANYLFRRPQALYPDTPALPAESKVVVRAADGQEAEYTLRWNKTGTAAGDFPPFTGPAAPAKPRSTEPRLAENPLERARRVPQVYLDALGPQEPELVIQGQEPPVRAQYALGLGARNPYYALPAGFTLRRGRLGSDNFVSGTYMADGLRIGLIRIPHFAPASFAAALAEFSEEITYFKANTDGLVVDCSRNTGGAGSLVTAYFARLTTRPFSMVPDRLMPTFADVVGTTALAAQVAALSRETWVIAKWRGLAEEVKRTYELGDRALTPPLPIEIEAGFNALTRGPLYDDNFPWLDAQRQPAGYDKPMIVLVDDLSGSAGDMFAAIVQDNRRAPLVGMRTWGLGGFVYDFTNALPYSQASVRLTGSMMTRREPVTVPGLPTGNVIEDLGVVPDIELDHQTRANLMNQGRDWVAGFTRIITQQIRQTPR